MIRNGETDETETPVNTLSRKLRIGLQTRDGPDIEVTWRTKDSTWKNQTRKRVSL